MKQLLMTFVCVLFALAGIRLFSTSKPAPEERLEKPAQQVTHEFDFGTITSGESLSFPFTETEVAQSRLLSVSCGCMSISFEYANGTRVPLKIGEYVKHSATPVSLIVNLKPQATVPGTLDVELANTLKDGSVVRSQFNGKLHWAVPLLTSHLSKKNALASIGITYQKPWKTSALRSCPPNVSYIVGCNEQTGETQCSFSLGDGAPNGIHLVDVLLDNVLAGRCQLVID